MKSQILCLLVLPAWACTAEPPVAQTPALDSIAVDVVDARPTQLAPMQAPEPPSTTAVDAYAGAEDWCYQVDDVPPCRLETDTDAHPAIPTDCPPDPHTGRTRVCVNPWWVAGEGRFCVPRPLDSRERERGRAWLKAFVYRRVDGRHEGICRPQNWWRSGQGHPVDAGKCDPDRLALFLTVVSWRESKHDDRRTHLLDPDQEAAAGAWKRKRETYRKNPHYWQSYRWRSRGRYGTNPALHLARWDRMAPPEALCNPVVSTEVYLETMRSCHRTLVSLRGGDPDWWDLHHCASGGKFARPAQVPTEHGSFFQRATKVGLDPFETVPIAWLGEAVPHTMQAAHDIDEKVVQAVATAERPKRRR
jgi:hypothetical protein